MNVEFLNQYRASFNPEGVVFAISINGEAAAGRITRRALVNLARGGMDMLSAFTAYRDRIEAVCRVKIAGGARGTISLTERDF